MSQEVDNLNRQITRSELESAILKTLYKQKSRLDAFTGKFYQTHKEELTPFLLKLSRKTEEARPLQEPSMKPLPPWERNKAKIPPKKENHRSVSLMNMYAEILKKILANQV